MAAGTGIAVFSRFAFAALGVANGRACRARLLFAAYSVLRTHARDGNRLGACLSCQSPWHSPPRSHTTRVLPAGRPVEWDDVGGGDGVALDGTDRNLLKLGIVAARAYYVHKQTSYYVVGGLLEGHRDDVPAPSGIA